LTKKLVREADDARDKKDMDALVQLIVRCDQRGEHLSTSPSGPRTAYKVLKDEKGFPKGIGRDRLMPLLRQLQDEGRIYRRTVKTLDRKWREIFTCTPAPTTAPMPNHRPDAAGQESVVEPNKECANET
jgi:hypothetical protein